MVVGEVLGHSPSPPLSQIALGCHYYYIGLSVSSALIMYVITVYLKFYLYLFFWFTFYLEKTVNHGQKKLFN